MAKENLRGASKAGKIAITRWVTKDTVEALKRLRGQGSHPNPTEGEVVDAAIAMYEAAHVKVSTGENVGDGAFRGKKMSAEEQRIARNQPPVIDDLGDGPNGGTDSNPDMEWSKDKYLREPPVGVNTLPVAPSPLEHFAKKEAEKVKDWAAGGDFRLDPAARLRRCIHCDNPMPMGSLPASTICKNCFLSGHRNMPGCQACAEKV